MDLTVTTRNPAYFMDGPLRGKFRDVPGDADTWAFQNPQTNEIARYTKRSRFEVASKTLSIFSQEDFSDDEVFRAGNEALRKM